MANKFLDDAGLKYYTCKVKALLAEKADAVEFTNDANAASYRKIVIATTGNDANEGTTAAPMLSIKAAVKKYSEAYGVLDIYVMDGTYTENIGVISCKNTDIAIRSNSEDKDAVTINMTAAIESSAASLRLMNLTLNITDTADRGVTVNAGRLYMHSVRVTLPEASTYSCVNVYNGTVAFLYDCVLNSGTATAGGAAVYGNNALLVRAYNCTSERTIGTGVYANYASKIEYTPTLTATNMTREADGGECIDLTEESGTLIVTITGDDTAGYAADKTPAEIKSAADSGRTVIAKHGNLYYTLVTAYVNTATFLREEESFVISESSVFKDTEERVLKSGDTMTGPLTLSGDPTSDLQAATKQYVDDGLSGKAASSHSHASGDITSGTLASDRLPTVPVTKGGTGATTAAAARTNLGAAAAMEFTSTTNAASYKKIVVGKNGSDSNAGTEAAPMSTIKGAIKKYAEAYKVLDIYVLDGTYTEDIGVISCNSTDIAIRSNSGNQGSVIINMSTAIESSAPSLRLMNLTFNVEVTGVRGICNNAGRLYMENVYVGIPEASTSSCVNIYNGTIAFLRNCVLNSGTATNSGAAVYGNQALLIRADNCTSSRTIGTGVYANNASKIEYTPTFTASVAQREENDGICTDLTAALPISEGGTGATTAAAARTALGAAASSHNHSASNITSGTLSAARGGTGQTTITPAVGTQALRASYAGTTDMTAGTSSLTTGALYFVYE